MIAGNGPLQDAGNRDSFFHPVFPTLACWFIEIVMNRSAMHSAGGSVLHEFRQP